MQFKNPGHGKSKGTEMKIENKYFGTIFAVVLIALLALLISTIASYAQGMHYRGWDDRWDDHGGSSGFYWNPRIFGYSARPWQPRIYIEPRYHREIPEGQLYLYAPGSRNFKKHFESYEPQRMEPELVPFKNDETEGTVIIMTNRKKLYYILDQDMAFEYPIEVDREGFAWHSQHPITKVVDWPTWTPPAAMRARQPDLPVSVPGGPRNPLGAVAIYLGNTEYRIHGTNDPRSIGKAVSSGCIRMYNEHALHLASMVHIGAIVKVR